MARRPEETLMATREEDLFKHLVQATFNTDAGRQLMDELVLMYCTRNFDENPYTMGRNCGRSDLVLFLKSVLDET
jgi:hypothetical protein